MTEDELVEVKPDRQLEVIDIKLHPPAEEFIEDLIMDFGTTLLVQAKTLAYQREDDIVLKNHVSDALNIIQQERRPKRWRNWAVALGGVLLGTFVSGFTAELSSRMHPIMLAIYVVLGFLGLILMFAGFKR